jgi:predicted nuclease with TOPRIM domain
MYWSVSCLCYTTQQECEELAQNVTDLTAINGTLRSELDELKKACEDMEAENSQLMVTYSFLTCFSYSAMSSNLSIGGL